MQAPLSSTASGQEQRRGPSTGLPSSMLAFSPASETTLDDNSTRRIGRPVFGEPVGRVADGAGLAHDAGNLLGALRLYCDLLARPGVLREEHHHYAEELQLLSLRSGTLIDRLLNPAATRRRRQAECSAGMIETTVPEVVEQCRGLLSTIARRAVAVAIGEGTGVPVPASREALERILVNLTKNAAEASAGGGAITLRVDRVEEERTGTGRESSKTPVRSRIVLSVEDQGRGMSVAAVKVLMAGKAAPDPVRIEDQERPGRGIGLRVVRELVRESSGELRLKSRSGCGTTVEIAWAVAAEEIGQWTRERQAMPAWNRNGNQAMQGGVSC